MMAILILLLLTLIAYMAGSIPWGVVLTRQFTTIDIRSTGSRNIGATNVRRMAGNRMGLLTLAGDVLKGMIPVWMAVRFFGGGESDLFIAIVALAAFLGHLYPVWLGFGEGGKGVATAAGCLLAVSPAAVGVALLVFILFVCMTSRVSVGSLAGAAALPLCIGEATGSGELTVCAGVMAAWIITRHRANIRRLMSGTEPRI